MTRGADEVRDAGNDDTVAAAALDATVPRTVTDTGAALDPSDPLAPTVAAHVGASATASEDWVGRTIGRYRIERRLGAGGMGVVWAAHDPALDRKVALKVLPPLDAERRAHLEVRLRREAQALARLDHPNVVAVYDVGVAAESVYVAMQLVDGTTLDRHLARATPPPAAIIALFLDACRGLAAAHAAGIIHRDVKPSNLLVDQAGRVYVGDFGLARGAGDDDDAPADDRSLLSAEMTRAGAVMGTPLYMAPEQHAGEPATARADQYSLCVSLWEALFGCHPFAVGRWQHDTALAAMRADRVVEPPRRRGVPARVVRALRRGLRCDPAARWESMDELAAAIAPRGYGGWIAAGAGAFGIGGAVALTLGLTSGGATPLATCRAGAGAVHDTWPGQREALRAVIVDSGVPGASAAADQVASLLARHAERWRATRLATCEATHATGARSAEANALALSCLDGNLVVTRDAVGMLLGGDRGTILHAVEVIAGLPDPGDCTSQLTAGVAPPPADQLTAISAVRVAIGRAHALVDAERLAEAERALTEVSATAAQLGYAPLLAEVGYSMAHVLEQRGAPTTIAVYEQAAQQAIAGRADAIAARAYIGALRVAGGLPDVAKIATLLPLAEALTQRLTSDAERELLGLARATAAYGEAHYHDSLTECAQVFDTARSRGAEGLRVSGAACAARAALALSDLDAAQTWAERWLTAAEAWAGAGTYSTVDALEGLAMTRRRAGRLDEAATLLGRARAITRRVVGDDNLELAGIEIIEAQLAHQRHRAAEGLPLIEHALRVIDRERPDSKTAVNARASLAQLHRQLDHVDLARAAFADALAMARKVLRPEDDALGVVLFNFGSFLGQQGDVAAAEPLLAEAEALWRSAGNPRHISVRQVRAEFLLEAGRAREAIPEFEAVITALRAAGHDAAAVFAAQSELADALWVSGVDRARARALMTEVADATARTGLDGDAADARAWLAEHPLKPAGGSARPAPSPP